jgi:hypothetical protein
MRYFIVILFLFALNSINLFSQSGMTFAEFAKKLSPYFVRELIMDIEKQLPQGSDYKIWGWDVGDFSGDGYNDVAFSIKVAVEKKRVVETYLFTDIDGYLVKVAQFDYNFIDIPLEIGVVISNNICMITKKNKQYDWDIDGFSFDNGTLLKHDEFSTRRLGSLTLETYTDYISLRNTLKLLNTSKGEETFFRDYMVIPSYERGRVIYNGYSYDAVSDYIDYVHKGAYFWEGEDDLSLNVRSAYDETFIYFTVEVNDESVVVQNCDSCIADHIEVWLDISAPFPNGKRNYNIENNQIEFKTTSDSGIYRFSVFPGNYKEEPAYVEIYTNNEINSVQRQESQRIKAISNLTEDGYIVKFKIPYLFLGLEDLPIRNSNLFEIGCTVIAVDYDNEFRPEENTEIATSAFDEYDPSTYGSLFFIPNEKWYGKTNNIFTQDIINNLLEYGF